MSSNGRRDMERAQEKREIKSMEGYMVLELESKGRMRGSLVSGVTLVRFARAVPNICCTIMRAGGQLACIEQRG
jgi:hypothetical protein